MKRELSCPLQDFRFRSTSTRRYALREKAYGDWAKALQSFGESPSEVNGSIYGCAYRIRYMGIDGLLAPLEQAQHRFATQEKEALAQSHCSNFSASATDSTLALDLEFRSAGKTKELAIIAAHGHIMRADGSADQIHANWMFHIPSGRFVTFDDLFADPQAAREHFSTAFRRGAHNDFYVVLGDVQKQKDFNAAYDEANAQASTPVPEHFRHLMIGMVDPARPTLIITFSERDLLPNVHELPHIELRSEYFSQLLKPQYRSAFDGTIFPE